MKSKKKKAQATKITIPPEPNTLYIYYSETSNGGESKNPDEQFSDREPEYREVTFKALTRRRIAGKMFCDSVEVSEETYNSLMAYLAVVRYSYGDTFGTTYSKWYVVGCYNSFAEAQASLLTALNEAIYKPWEGYFASLEGTEVHPLPIS